MKPILQMCNITKRFVGVTALNNVNIELRHGEILGVCGENGAGKSTLMKILAGSYAYGEYEGEMLFEGKPVHLSSVIAARKLGIEMVYQEVNMIPKATIAENLMVGDLPGKGAFVNYKELNRLAQEAMQKLDLSLDPKTLTYTLKSGQLQMISILRAVMKKPKVLILDEPTTALAEHETQQVFKVLRDLCKGDVSCIYISHKLDEIFELCDRVQVIRDGQTIACHEVGSVTRETLIEEMVGRKLEQTYKHTCSAQEEEVLRVEHLTIPHPTIAGKNIIEDLSFTLHKGEILGLGGLVGAGRSEVLEAIFGKTTAGVQKKIFIKNKETEICCPSDAIQAGIGFLTEERKLTGLVLGLSIRSNMSLASLPRLKGKWFIDRKRERAILEQQMQALRIKAPSIETIVRNLSGGNQQKVALSKWLLNGPDILLLDEPTKGVDVGAKREFYKYMDSLTQRNISIILVSSDMPEFITMCDRCLVLSGGKVSAELKDGNITQSNIMHAAI